MRRRTFVFTSRDEAYFSASRLERLFRRLGTRRISKVDSLLTESRYELEFDDLLPYDQIQLMLTDARFPPEAFENIIQRALAEDRDPVEITRQEVELVRRLE